ncbi:hypothetical protein [Priestia koreensis]|uniref:hypothetical protein n=1 Tax=Priestia koreensis TaxID=284581 RepID=UPI00345B3D2C
MWENFEFKIAWCPICSQGWVEIVKDIETKELYVMCNECENEWDHPLEVKTSKARTEINENLVTIPTIEEIQSVDWGKYIIKE